jgi:O-antigen/teichoic acid export membrane protein
VTEAPTGDEHAPSPDETPKITAHSLRRIVSGLGWNTSGQVVMVLVNVGLTPYLLMRLGLDRYGLYALLSSFRGLLSNLDGGLGPTSVRYFSVYAGAGDRRATSSLLLTISGLLALVVGVVTGLVAIFAPDLVVVLHTSASLHRSAAMLLRYFMVLLFIATFRGVLQRIISAEHRWAYLNISQTGAVLVYAGLAVLLVGQGHGLVGLLWASVGQESVLVVLSVVGAYRHIDFQQCRWMSWSEIRAILHYAARVQVAEITSSFNFEIDALIVGFLFPIRDVGFYSIGANFSAQLVGLPMNAVAPIAVTVSRTYGSFGLGGAIKEFTHLQQVWVRAIGCYSLVGAVSAYFAISRWLGPREHLAAAVASILLVGQTTGLLSRVMDEFVKSINRPGIESRYLGVGTLVNVAFTIPLAFAIGMLGVPIGTALGATVSSLYFIRLARREVSPSIQSFLAELPVLATGVAVAITGALELLVYRWAPRGVVGLLLCGVPALIALGVYALITAGGRPAIARLRNRTASGLQ